MSLFVIADLHLSLSADKPMDIFGGWDNYVSRLEANWQESVSLDDTVVIPGDISWAMGLENALEDFRFIDRLNGRKIILKGNHDYWWTTKSKADKFFSDNGIESISILHNNHYFYGDIGICGTRGWVSINGETADAKVLAREVQRLEVSIQSALKEQLTPIVFLHYPPIYGNSYNYEILEVLHRYAITECYYGHIHGKAHQYAFEGVYEETKMHLISGDYIQFKPVKIV